MSNASRLNELIRERGMTKSSFAKQLEISPSTLSTWIDRGEDFPARYVLPMCRILNVAPERLLEGIDKPYPDIPSDYVKLSPDEQFLVETVRPLDREGLHIVISTAIEEVRRVRASRGSSGETGSA